MALPGITRGLHSQFRRFGFAFFFTLLVGAGIIFRGFLTRTLDNTLRDNMNAEWAAMKGVLQIQNGIPVWIFDREDPDQTYAIARLQRVYMLADALGSVLQISDVYTALDRDTPKEIEAAIRSPHASWKFRKDTQGASYLIRSGVVYSSDQSHTPYFVAIGRPLTDNQKVVDKLTQLYVGLIAIVIGGAWLGRRDWQPSLPVN